MSLKVIRYINDKRLWYGKYQYVVVQVLISCTVNVTDGVFDYTCHTMAENVITVMMSSILHET